MFFERNVLSQHLQLQAVPVPKNSNSLKTLFQDFARSKYNITFDTVSPKDVFTLGSCDYFQIELPDQVVLLHKVKERFPLQLGRELVSLPEVLDMESRVDWKACRLEKEKEALVTKRVRADFGPFDFTQ